jgi:hypothetical protein
VGQIADQKMLSVCECSFAPLYCRLMFCNAIYGHDGVTTNSTGISKLKEKNYIFDLPTAKKCKNKRSSQLY